MGFISVLMLIILMKCYSEPLKELRLLGLQAMTGKTYSGGWACLVPVQMAINDVNDHPDLLVGYNLTYDYFDHEVKCRSFIISDW